MKSERKLEILMASIGAIITIAFVAYFISSGKDIIGAITVGVGAALIATYVILTNHKIHKREHNLQVQTSPTAYVDPPFAQNVSATEET